MTTQIDPQLSADLQELYLENKEWLSEIHFMEDEMRFFKNLFKVHLAKGESKNVQVEVIGTKLDALLTRRKKLKAVLDARQKKLTQLLQGKVTAIGIDFIEEDTAIVNEIKALMAMDKVLRKELFALVEQLKTTNQARKSAKRLKTHPYPIL